MCWDPKSNMASLKVPLSLRAASDPLSFSPPLFLFYVLPFGVSKKKKKKIIGKIKKIMAGHILKLPLMYFGRGCQLTLPCGVPQARRRRRTYLSHH